MRVTGEFKPPIIGHHVEPYPVSGRGAVELVDDRLLLEGSRGLPWEVQVLGTIGFAIGCVAMYLIAGLERSRNAAFAGFGALLACVAAGSGLGYAASRRRNRPVRKTELALASVVSAVANEKQVEITVQFRKRWQTRRQMIHFSPSRQEDGSAFVDMLNYRRSVGP
jgi:hypothetical protein